MGTDVQTFMVSKARIRNSLMGVVLLAVLPLSAWADKTDEIITNGLSRQKAGSAAQKRIDEIAEATDKIVSQYHQQSKVVDGLKVYNDQLRRTLAAQQAAVGKLETSIEGASLIERQIVPLMLRMIDGLDKFVAADIPFKKDEREARIARIRSYLNNANITAAERFRQVLEAYSIESDYGKTLSVYTETLKLDSGNLTANILQVGRTGLYYLTLDGEQAGFWDKRNGGWTELDSSYNEGIAQAIRITQGKESKGLMELPIVAPEVL